MQKTIALALALAATLGAAARTDAAEPRSVSVSATGTVSAVPDMARIAVGVSARAPAAQAAADEAAARAQALLAALDSAGIAPADRRTQHIGIVPIHARDDRSAPLRIEGYEARQHFEVTVRDLARLGPLIDSLVKAGSATLGGIAFDVAARDSLLDEARRRAVAEARRLAALAAEAAGARLGQVLNLSLGGEGGYVPRPAMRTAAEPMAAPPMPVAEGTIDISASASATFALE